ncbi:hypothetical protein [Actinoplanes sp. NPDC089786]|uniref:hypothetical protein n=1 Tax=Actinoplanes sp. NPDC089786 TaxID=3155185 RepID=UPI00341208B0
MILVHGVAADGRLRVTEGTGERLVTPEELHELTAPHLPPGETVWLLSCAGGLPNGIAQRFAEARESDVVAAVDDVTAGATAPGRDGAVLVTKGGQSWLLFVPSNRTLGRDVWDVVNEVDGGRPFDGVTAEEPTGATGGVRLAEGTEGEATNVELIMNQQTINDLMLETDSRSKVLAENKYLKIVVEEHGGKWIPEVVTKPVKMFAGDVGHLATRDVEQALDEIFDWFESIDQETTLDQLRHYGFAVKHLASMVRVRRPDPGSPIILGVQFSVGTPPYVVPDFLTYAQSTNYNHDAEDLLDQARSFAAPYGASAGLNGREAESLQGFITHLYTHFGAVVKSSKNDAWKSNLVVVERTNFDGYREGLPKDVRDYVVEHGKEIMDSITRSFEQEFRNPGGALLRNSHLTAADYLRSAVVPDAQPVNQYQALGIRFYFPELDYNRDSDGAPRFPEGLVVQELRTYGRNVRLGSTRAALQQNRRELRQDVMRRVDPLDPSFGQIRATFDMDDDAMRSGQDGQVRVLARLIASHVKINPKTKPLKALRDYNIMLEGGGSRAWRGAKHARDKGDNRARAVWSELSAELAELLTEEELAAVVPIFTSRGDGPSIAPEGIRPDVSSPSDRRKVAVWGVPEAASAIPSTPTAGNNATQSSSTARWSAEDSTSGTTARPPFPVTPHHLADHSHPNRVLLLPPGDTDNQTAAKNYHLEPDEYGAFVHADKHGPHLNSHRITEQQLAEIIATHPDSAGKKLVLIACGPTTTYLNNTLKALPHHPSIAAPNTTYYTPINPTPDQPSGWAATLTYDHNGTPHFTPGHFNIVTRQPGTNTLTHTTHTTPIPDPLPANHTTTWAVQRLPIIGRPQTVEITREPRGDTADGFFTISERHISVSGKGLPVGTQLEDLTHVRWTATPHPNGQPGEYAVTFHSLEDGDDHLPLWSQVYASSPFTAEQVKESLPQPRSAIQGRPGSEALREAVPSPPFAAEARTLDEAIGRERSIKIASTAVTVSKAPPAVVFAMGLYPPGGGSGADAVTGWQTDSLRGRPEAGSHLYIGVFRGGRTSSIGFDVETTGLVPSDVLAGAWPISSIDGNNVVLEEWQANSQFASAARSAFDRDLSFDHVRRWFAELNLTVHVSAPSNRLNAPESDRPIVSRLASDEVFHGYDELIQSQATGLSLAGDTKAAASQLVNFLADQGQFSTPDVEIDQLGSRAGSFSRDEWEIWIDAATRVEELSTVVLHETGHVEQWFSVARMVAGWGSPDVLRMWFPRTPQRVLDAAWANPMISDDPQYGLAVAIASENFPSSAGADLRVLRNLLDQRLDRAIDNIERALSDGASHLSPDVADQLKILGAIARLAIAADFAYRENAAEAASFGLEELQARWNRGGQEKPQQGAPNGTQFLPDTITTAMSRDDVTVQLALLGPGGRLRVPADMLGFDPIFSDSALAHFKLVRGQQPRFEEWIDFVSPMDMARQGIFAATSKPRVFEFYASWVVEVLPTETWWVRPADFQGSPPSFGSATPLIMVGAAGVATSTVVALAVRSLVRDWGADALNDPAILQIHANPGTNAFQVTKELYEAAGVSIRSSEADGWAVTALGQDSRDLYYYAGNADAGFVLGDLASRLITVADGLGSADERVSSALTDVSALAAHVGAASVKGLFDAAYAAARQYGLDGITTDRLMETRQTIDSAVSDGRHGSLLWSTIAEASTPGSVAGGQSTPATEAHSEDVLTLRPHNNAPSSPTVRPPFPATPHHLADHSHPNRVLLLHPSDTDNQTAAKNYHLEPDEYGAFVHADQHGPHLNNHHITEQQLAETITRHPDSAGKKIILIACGPTTTYLNNTLKALPHHPSIAAPNTTYHTPINPTPDQPPGFVGTLTYDHNGTPHLEPAHFNILTRQPGTNTLTHTTQPTPIPNPLPPPHTTTNWTKPDRQQRSQTSPPAPPATSRTGETSRVRPSIDDDAASGSDAIMAVADESDSDVERHSSRGPRGAMNQQDGQSGSRRILPSSQGKRRAESGSDPGEGPNKRARGELPAENGWTPEFRTQYRIVAGRFERLRNPFAPRVTGTIRERYPRPYDRTPEERAEQSQRHLALAFFDVLHRQGQQLPTDGGDDELAGADDRMSDGELSDPGSSDSELSDPGSSDSELSDLESSDIELPDAGERVSVDDDRMSRDEPSEDDSSTYESGDEPSEDDSSAYESGGESENSTDDAYGESEPESSASERAAKPQRRRKSRRAGKATKAEDHEYEIQTTWLWRRILIASNQNSTVDEAVRLLGEQPGETPAEQFRSFLALGHPDAGRGLGEDGNAATNYRDGLEDAHVKLREGYDGDRHNDTTDVLRNLKGWTVVEAEPRTEAEQEHLRNVLIGDEFADHIVFVRHSPADGVMHAELKNMIALRSLDPSEAGRVRTYGKFRPCMVCSGVLRHAADAGYDVRYNPNHGGLRHTAMQNVATHLPWTMHHPGGRPGNYMLDYLRQKANELVSSSAYRRQPPRPGHYEGTPHGPEKVVHPHEAPAKPDNTPSNSEVSETEQGFVSRPRKMVDRQIKVFDSLGRRRLGDNLAPADKAALRDASSRDRTDPAGAAGDVFNRLVERHLDEGIDIDEIAHVADRHAPYLRLRLRGVTDAEINAVRDAARASKQGSFYQDLSRRVRALIDRGADIKDLGWVTGRDTQGLRRSLATLAARESVPEHRIARIRALGMSDAEIDELLRAAAAAREDHAQPVADRFTRRLRDFRRRGVGIGDLARLTERPVNQLEERLEKLAKREAERQRRAEDSYFTPAEVAELKSLAAATRGTRKRSPQRNFTVRLRQHLAAAQNDHERGERMRELTRITGVHLIDINNRVDLLNKREQEAGPALWKQLLEGWPSGFTERWRSWREGQNLIQLPHPDHGVRRGGGNRDSTGSSLGPRADDAIRKLLAGKVSVTRIAKELHTHYRDMGAYADRQGLRPNSAANTEGFDAVRLRALADAALDNPRRRAEFLAHLDELRAEPNPHPISRLIAVLHWSEPTFRSYLARRGDVQMSGDAARRGLLYDELHAALPSDFARQWRQWRPGRPNIAVPRDGFGRRADRLILEMLSYNYPVTYLSDDLHVYDRGFSAYARNLTAMSDDSSEEDSASSELSVTMSGMHLDGESSDAGSDEDSEFEPAGAGGGSGSRAYDPQDFEDPQRIARARHAQAAGEGSSGAARAARPAATLNARQSRALRTELAAGSFDGFAALVISHRSRGVGDEEIAAAAGSGMNAETLAEMLPRTDRDSEPGGPEGGTV